ncbi:unnamed protein product, partial [Rotaria socialis]
KYFEKSLRIQETLPSPDYSLTHALRIKTAQIYESFKNYGAALQHAESYVSEASSVLGSDHQTVKATQDYIESLRRVTT